MSRRLPVRSRRDPENTLVEKGSSDALRIDWNEIERNVKFLRDNYYAGLDELDPKMEASLQKIKNMALKLRGTSSYSNFYSMLTRHFGDLETTDFLPHTVGSYCYGCSTANSRGFVGNKSCSLHCASDGGIMSPEIAEMATCTDNVYLLNFWDEYENNKSSVQHEWKDLQVVGPEKFSYIFAINNSANPIEISEELLVERGIKKYSLHEYRNGAMALIKSGEASSKSNLLTAGASGNQQVNIKKVPEGTEASGRRRRRSRTSRRSVQSFNHNKQGDFGGIVGVIAIFFLVFIIAAAVIFRRAR